MNLAPDDVLFYFADRDSSIDQALQTLYQYPSQPTVEHFLRVNAHLKNNRILTGQMVIITPENPWRCTIWEHEMALAAQQVDLERERMTAKERELLAKNFALIGNAASYSGTMYGWTSTYFDQKKRHVERVLKRIEDLYRTTYDATGELKGDQFFARRRALLMQVDTTINGMFERRLFGQDIHANRVKSQLGLSSKSIVHQWNALGGAGDIKGFSSNYRRLTNTARTFNRVGYLAIGLDVSSSIAAIAEACAVEPDSAYCKKTKFSQSGRILGSVTVGAGGGTLGSTIGASACSLLFGPETLGAAVPVCIAIFGMGGGYFGSKLGSEKGAKMGEVIYNNSVRAN